MMLLRLLLIGLICGVCVSCQQAKLPPPAATPAAARSTKTLVTEPSTTAVEDLGTRQTGVDWPYFLGPERTSKSPETGILTEWPEGGPPLVWQREIGEGYGIGSLSRGRFYQFDRYQDEAQLLCLNGETGELLWSFSYPTDYIDLYGYNGGPRSSPLVDGSNVYIYGAEGMLHCLRANDGQLIWKVDTFARFGVVQNFFGVSSTPVIEGDLLIVMVGGSPAESQKVPPGQLDRVEGNGTGIVAFNKHTGEVVYSITDELASYASLQLATIGDRRWCFALLRGGLIGFEPASGQVDFHYPWRASLLESVNASTPVVVGDEVFISETYGPGASLLRVTPGKYEIVWRDEPRQRQKAMQAHWMTPVYHDGYLYGSSGRNVHDAELRCIDWKTGEVQWSKAELGRSSLLYVDGHFVCLTEFGQLLLLKANPERYEAVADVIPRGQSERAAELGIAPPAILQPPCWAAPILAHGLLYLRGAGKLVCLELIPHEAEKD